METRDFSPNKSFLKSLKERLKEKGLLLTNEELSVVYKAFLETIVYDYVFKFKKLTFLKFGTFEGALFRIKAGGVGMAKDGKPIVYPKLKYTQSLDLKNEFKRYYKTLQEKRD